ncbi:MAG: ATP-dependent sacrificial sulfur transferase LarE [Candidatus Krumholzibacteria bacterium]|jgi:uncharacterized protein|nr:ATP-dependent sacrificial sulfur transferase LarE [Candidatus Krumholzibacteria bacterium]
MRRLKGMLGRFDEAIVAFSGGVDSTFLAGVAAEVLGDGLVAVTVTAPFISKREVEEAKAFAESRGIRHEIVDVDMDAIDHFTVNPPDRCYHCKKAIFAAIAGAAGKFGIDIVMDASNLEDALDYRPGMKALEELGILSPLREAGLTKEEIRELSRQRGYPNWDKPSSACLASRIPYGERITAEKLGRVEEAEAFLADEGFAVCRVRSHGDLARIEIAPEMIPRLTERQARVSVAEKLKGLGFRYVTVDIEGYRTGSLNESLDL